MRESNSGRQSLAHKMLTFQKSQATRKQNKSNFKRMGGGGMTTHKGLAYRSGNLSDSELSPMNSARDSARKGAEIQPMRVEVKERKEPP